MNKPAETTYPIHHLLRQRWSPRAFEARPVEREKLLSVLEAARWAPSSYNAQPWRFIVAPQQREAAFNKLLSVIKENNQRWAKNAGVLMLAVTYRLDPHGSESKNARHDLGQAVANLTIQATALGLSVRQMGGIHADKAREVYGIPEDYDVLNAIALGYKDSPDSLPDDLAGKERASRHRNPLSSFVFEEWEEESPILAEAAAAVSK